MRSSSFFRAVSSSEYTSPVDERRKTGRPLTHPHSGLNTEELIGCSSLTLASKFFRSCSTRRTHRAFLFVPVSTAGSASADQISTGSRHWPRSPSILGFTFSDHQFLAAGRRKTGLITMGRREKAIFCISLIKFASCTSSSPPSSIITPCDLATQLGIISSRAKTEASSSSVV